MKHSTNPTDRSTWRKVWLFSLFVGALVLLLTRNELATYLHWQFG